MGLHGGLVLLSSATALRGVLSHHARDATRANLDSDHAVSAVIRAAARAITRGSGCVGTAGVTSATLGVHDESRLATDPPHELEFALAGTARLVLSALVSDLDFESALNDDDVAARAATVEVAIAFGHGVLSRPVKGYLRPRSLLRQLGQLASRYASRSMRRRSFSSAVGR